MRYHVCVTAAYVVFFLTWVEIYMNIYKLSSFHDQFGFLKPYKRNCIYDVMTRTERESEAALVDSSTSDISQS